MKLGSLMRLISLVALLLVTVVVRAHGAQSVASTSTSVPFKSCSADSIITITSVSISTPYSGSGILNVTASFTSNEYVTSGSWSMYANSPPGWSGSHWYERDNGSLATFLSLPITQGPGQFVHEVFLYAAGGAQIELIATDQNDEWIMCFSFIWDDAEQQQQQPQQQQQIQSSPHKIHDHQHRQVQQHRRTTPHHDEAHRHRHRRRRESRTVTHIDS